MISNWGNSNQRKQNAKTKDQRQKWKTELTKQEWDNPVLPLQSIEKSTGYIFRQSFSQAALQPESGESTGSQGIIVPGLTRFRLSEKKNRKQFSNSQCLAKLEVLVIKEHNRKTDSC